MSNTWFTADTHFGHKRIIELCKRPFASVDHMNEVLITKWNARVKPYDQVYHLGDFAFGKSSQYLERLNGLLTLVKGNHDPVVVSDRWQTVDNLLEIEIGDTSLVLCHYALKTWNKARHGALHLYGHSHNTLPGDSQCCDVGVDCWDFNPVSLDEIRARVAASPPHQEPFK